jgi:hypothetical protein
MCRYADKNALSIDVLAAAWQEPSAWQGTTDLGVTLTNEVWGRIALTEMVVHGWDLATATDQPCAHCRPPSRCRGTLRMSSACSPGNCARTGRNDHGCPRPMSMI